MENQTYVVCLLVLGQFLLNLSTKGHAIFLESHGSYLQLMHNGILNPKVQKARNIHRRLVSEATHSKSKLGLLDSISVERHLYIHM